VHFPVLIWAGNAKIDDDALRNVIVISLVGGLTVCLTIFVERPFQAVRSRNRAPVLPGSGEKPLEAAGAAPVQVGADH
jgi:hypothetical protein